MQRRIWYAAVPQLKQVPAQAQRILRPQRLPRHRAAQRSAVQRAPPHEGDAATLPCLPTRHPFCAAGKWGGPQPRHRATQPDGMPRAHLKCPATGLLEIATAPSPRCSTAMRWESRRSRARERRGNVGLGTAASAAAAVAILSLESAPASRPGGGMSAHGHACIVAAGCRRCRPRRPRYIYMLPTV